MRSLALEDGWMGPTGGFSISERNFELRSLLSCSVVHPTHTLYNNLYNFELFKIYKICFFLFYNYILFFFYIIFYNYCNIFYYFFLFITFFFFINLSQCFLLILSTDWVNLSKIWGMDGVFRGLAGLLRGKSQGADLPVRGKPGPSLLFNWD